MVSNVVQLKKKSKFFGKTVKVLINWNNVKYLEAIGDKKNKIHFTDGTHLYVYADRDTLSDKMERWIHGS